MIYSKDMMTHAKDPILKEIVNRLCEEFRPEKIYLFGSRAKGSAKNESDYDLAVIVPDSKVSMIERMKQAERILWGIWVSTDILVYTRKEFDELVQSSEFVETVSKEGIELDVA